MNTPLVGNEAGLVGYWKFNEGSGQVAIDSSGNDNHGQLGSTSGIDNNDPEWVEGLIPILYPDLYLTMAGSPKAPLGSNINYELTIQNNGNITAPNVVITHTLPPNVVFVSSTSFGHFGLIFASYSRCYFRAN
jgi:uncharacterized repeat protein (TIGR01451 family)